ncbi:GntR family transcriptional regulator [Aerosticca soli]|uniref:Transcriptional regulator, GntR family n=1 Tax=Aerosticca soli TaxID=2010829 RepID=A0A2Z6E3L1_9GAMM|nr:FCD domain-containing protein [Aerosticca soli]BBD79547.1 transcriptional regulator, GntR family [Aerosticca soli]
MPPENVTTLSDQAYGRLKQDIILGLWQPGSRLGVRQLSDHYRIGASPIREALARLVGEGLVLAIGQRGFRVPPIDLADLWDVTRTRVLIETEALRQSIEHGGDAWEAQLVAAYHQLEKLESAPAEDFTEWEWRNQRFHEALVAACPSRWLQRLRATLYDQHRRYRFLSTRYAPSRDIHAEHRALREAALAGDVGTAADILRVHIERTAHSVEHALARRQDADHASA